VPSRPVKHNADAAGAKPGCLSTTASALGALPTNGEFVGPFGDTPALEDTSSVLYTASNAKGTPITLSCGEQ